MLVPFSRLIKRFEIGVIALVWLAFVSASAINVVAVAQPVSKQTATDSSVKSLDDLVLHDTERNKDLHVRITYPAVTRLLPVIVFSHGAGGSKDSYRFLIDYWAKNGYFVIQPTHADSIGKPASPGAGMKTMIKVIRELPTDYSGWNNRFRDISFVIDSLPKIQKEVGAKLDPAKIGVGGHSYGAFTTVIIAGGKVPAAAAASVKTSRDNRVKAVLAISPQSARNRDRDFGFDDTSAWQNIHIPAMFMTGTYDQTGWTKAPERRQAFAGSPPGDKYFVIVEGANHMTFAGGRPQAASFSKRSSSTGIASRLSRRFGPPEQGDHELMLEAIKQASTLFWDAYLKGDIRARENLQSKSLATPGSLLGIEYK